MNIVVTGAEGFLGRRVVARLSALGYSVIALDRIYHGADPIPGVLNHHADLADPQYLLPANHDASEPFILIHLAWDMRRYEGYAIQAEQVRQFAALLDFWESRGLSRIIAMGSAEEYGHRSGILSERDAPELPLSPYGWAKRSARDLLASWSRKTAISAAWLRPFIMYGPGQKGDMLIPFAIEAARQKKRTAFTDGKQRRDFIFIEDVVDALELCLKCDAAGFQEYNLGCGKEIPVVEELNAIAKRYAAESFFDLGARPRRPNEPDVQVADISEAKRMLRWAPKTDWPQGLDRVFQE